MGDQADLRAGDRDRDRIAERLRAAVGEGRITLDELSERLDRLYRARTYGELEALVADLPRARSPEPREDPDHLLLFTRGVRPIRKTGRWRVPPRITLDCTWRTAVVDFRYADCPHREIDMTVRCDSMFGDVVIRVPIGWRVVADEVTSGGWIRLKRVHNTSPVPPDPDGVVLRLSGHIGGDIWVRYHRVP
ncbi:hypothetical protein GCM10010116_35410 [Microbispora rosea subsp. aerata]|nr:DUF1707 domain-containing protein [Microbispora rosea]GGO17493.1 hypothetical protein GCM10010116_35410 [Microbispora rosea subsp. aerata]GIH56555.1 hypothetical protein Mro02_34690 [Microbispora rosea subsp. aerata]GLJ81916.1 hypothetical protein GCM10017588_06410 [Microbispora rosea subsp. aerata]